MLTYRSSNILSTVFTEKQTDVSAQAKIKMQYYTGLFPNAPSEEVSIALKKKKKNTQK